jgi:hypothetical protein
VRKEKLVNALLYAVEHGGHIGRTKLLKFIFLVDLIHYNQRGTTLCGTAYIRMPKGPAEATAFEITSESNAYLDVNPPREPRRRAAYESYEYKPRRKADLTSFTHYELALLRSVLRWISSRGTDQISELTHYFRLWTEFSDGDDIPLEYFQLNRHEISYLEQSGLHVDGFERNFCKRVIPISNEVADALHPPNAERIATVEGVLDTLIAAYPLPDLEVFYDAYLAWDDTYRSTLRNNPQHVLAVATEGCDALCFVAYVVATHMIPAVYRDEDLKEFCDNAERRFNTERSAILRDNPPSIPPDSDEDVQALVDMAMHISRDLACSGSPVGRS